MFLQAAGGAGGGHGGLLGDLRRFPDFSRFGAVGLPVMSACPPALAFGKFLAKTLMYMDIFWGIAKNSRLSPDFTGFLYVPGEDARRAAAVVAMTRRGAIGISTTRSPP
jgi:hypothetical protein